MVRFRIKAANSPTIASLRSRDMCRDRSWTGLAVCGLLVLVRSAWGDDLEVAAPPVHNLPAAQALAARIDELIAQRWDALQVRPAAQVDDAGFLRRVYLDLAGKIPSASETRAFLDDPS